MAAPSLPRLDLCLLPKTEAAIELMGSLLLLGVCGSNDVEDFGSVGGLEEEFQKTESAS